MNDTQRIVVIIVHALVATWAVYKVAEFCFLHVNLSIHWSIQ